MKTKISAEIIHRIMDRASFISSLYPQECRDFRIMSTFLDHKSLILRWTTIDLTDIDRPIQRFHYECFSKDGKTRKSCRLYYKNNREANDFFWSLEPLYKQQFANDHKPNGHV